MKKKIIMVLIAGFLWEAGVVVGAQKVNNVSTNKVFVLDKIIVTEKGRKSNVMNSSRAVNVISRYELDRKMPSNMKDVFSGQEGVDVSTTGPNSIRPTIRGMFDDRILILFRGICEWQVKLSITWQITLSR